MTANPGASAAPPFTDDLITVLEGIGDSFYTLDAAWRFTYLNRTAEEYFGTSRESVLGRVIWEVFPAAEGSSLHQLMQEAMTKRVTSEVEADSVIVPGRFIQFRAFPYRDGLAVAFRDRSAERAAKEAVAESEALFRALAESLPQQVWVMRSDGFATYMNRRFRDYHGIEVGPQRESRGATIHPDDREQAFAVRAAAMNGGEPFTVDVRTRRFDGEYRWQRMFVEPLRLGGGERLSWIGTATDIDDMRRTQDALAASEARLQLLVYELNHRVKNAMAVAQAIANHTLRASTDLNEAKVAMTGRFNALGTAVDLLTRSKWSGADIGELVALNLSGFSGRFKASGPSVTLAPRAAQTLSLVLYELASNAAKHGALSVPGGRVVIEWQVADDEFRFAWREEHGPRVAKPTHRGFGQTLLERVASADLGASVALEFPEEGVRYRIIAPARDAVGELEPIISLT